MALELSSLRNAVSALKAVLGKSEDAELMRGLDEVTRKAVKSGAILHFAFTYDLCFKFLRRWLEINRNLSAGVTRRELFRLAAESRLIVDFDGWMRHSDQRNLTSHTYDAKIAESVYQVTHEFTRDAQRLLEALEARND